MLNIIFVSPHSDPQATLGEPDSGGQCVYEHELALALSQLPNVQVTTLCRDTGRRPPETLVNRFYQIHRLPCGPSGFVPKEEIEQYIPEFIDNTMKRLPDHDWKKTVIHGHYWDGARTAIGYRAKLNHHIPMIWSPHSLGALKRASFSGWPNEQKLRFVPRVVWESYMMLLADRVVVSSVSEAENIASKYQIPESQIQMITPGVDFETLKPLEKEDARKKFNLPAQGKIILCLGRMSPSKGYQRAIRTLAALKEMRPDEDVKLVICGGSLSDNASVEENEYLSSLVALVTELQLEKSVIFHTAIPRDQVASMFSACDLFFMPSDQEPFGLVMIEAMALKRPVVAANAGGPSTVLQHNRTGTLVDFENAQQVAKYTYSLLKDEQLYTSISEAAYRYAVREFQWYQKATQFQQLYKNISRHRDTDEAIEWLKNDYFSSKLLGT